ncbi:MAG: outer membrane lipoprotein carrier protein LolA [Anderseniella sp.]|jgi:outer membrane lipoprotein-sorting protein|nr:outer membrane lipoprotein carrier protein LolA [Anderseniella sp.]
MIRRTATLAALAAAILIAPAMNVLLGTTGGSAFANTQLTDNDKAALTQLNAYLNEIRNLSGEFTQTSPRGQVASGIFYIAKPGKMRFEYAPPSPLLVVSDGNWVTVKNTQRKSDDQYPLSTTPLKLVLADQVNLFEQAVILNVEHTETLSAITMQEKGQLVAGQLTMVFDRANNELVQWIIVDGKGQRTSVELSNIDKTAEPNPKLFVVQRSRAGSAGSDR